MAKKLSLRLDALEAADTLGDFWPPYSGPERCHELKGDRAGSYFDGCEASTPAPLQGGRRSRSSAGPDVRGHGREEALDINPIDSLG